jgi:hypothetical protein
VVLASHDQRGVRSVLWLSRRGIARCFSAAGPSTRSVARAVRPPWRRSTDHPTRPWIISVGAADAFTGALVRKRSVLRARSTRAAPGRCGLSRGFSARSTSRAGRWPETTPSRSRRPRRRVRVPEAGPHPMGLRQALDPTEVSNIDLSCGSGSTDHIGAIPHRLARVRPCHA